DLLGGRICLQDVNEQAKDPHILLAKFARRPSSHRIGLRRMMEYRIRSAPWKERAVAAAGCPFQHGSMERWQQWGVQENFIIRVLVDMAKSKAMVPNLCQHSPLIGGIYRAIIVIHNDGDAKPSEI